MPIRLFSLLLLSLPLGALANSSAQETFSQPLQHPYPFAIVEEKDELETGRENCFLTVTIQYRSKKTEVIQHAFEADSREDCAERRELFGNNFSPREVLKKHVSMKWGRK